MAKLQRRDRKISDMLKKGRSHDHIAKELMISPSEVVSSIKRLERHGIRVSNERSASTHGQGS